MAWTESGASRRQLLGQLAGQVTEAAKLKAAKKGQTQDILAGYGQQALGYFGEKGLETQRQTGREVLAGLESGLRQQEDISRIGVQSKADQAYLEKQIDEYYSQLPEWQQQAEKKRVLEEWKASGLSARDFWMGHAPREPGEEKTLMEEAIADPAGWVTDMMFRFRENEQIVGPLTDEQWAAFDKWGKGMIDQQFPEMDPGNRQRLEFAIDLALGEHLKEEEEVSGGRAGEFFSRKTVRERAKIRDTAIDDLTNFAKSLDKNDPLNGIISRLIAEGSVGDIMLPGGVLMTEEKLNDWINRVNQILRPSILEQRRGGPGATMQELQGQLERSYGEHPH